MYLIASFWTSELHFFSFDLVIVTWVDFSSLNNLLCPVASLSLKVATTVDFSFKI